MLKSFIMIVFISVSAMDLGIGFDVWNFPYCTV